MMSRIAPKPIIARVAQTWDAGMGMKIALVEDMERKVWVVESCPAGTHFWTLAQAQELAQGSRVGQALRAAVAAGRALNVPTMPQMPAPVAAAPPIPRIFERETAPRIDRRSQPVEAGAARPLRRATRQTGKTAVCA